jgi:hypothetical protein
MLFLQKNFFLRQGLNIPALASQVLRLQVCPTMPVLLLLHFFTHSILFTILGGYCLYCTFKYERLSVYTCYILWWYGKNSGIVCNHTIPHLSIANFFTLHIEIKSRLLAWISHFTIFFISTVCTVFWCFNL